MAQALNKRLVVATATIALQEQFVNKDLPDIRDSSGLDFSFALAKGRRRYVCLSKLDRLMGQGQGESDLLPLYPDEVARHYSGGAAGIYRHAGCPGSWPVGWRSRQLAGQYRRGCLVRRDH